MNINKTILAILIVLITIVSISAVSAEDIVTDNVVATQDDVAVVEASADTDVLSANTYDIPNGASVSEIKSIINKTEPGDTLKFAENGTYDFGNISKAIEIEHTLILEGNGATIKGYQGFLIAGDEKSVAGTEVHDLNFIMTQNPLWNGRSLEFTAGDGYVIDGCTFTNGNSGIYIRNGKGSKNKITITNCKFYGEEGATNHSSIGKQKEQGMKAINIMGGNGIKISNNYFEGDMLDAVSIASGASNVEMYENTVNNVWYGVFYGGGITNITVQDNTFTNNKIYALGVVKAAGTSDFSNNTFTTLENATAIYVEEGNTAHGAPSNIETILIYDNTFLGAGSTMVSASSKGGMITPEGEFTVVNNDYEQGITVFAFTDNNTYTFKTSNLIVEEKNVTIENNNEIPAYANPKFNITEDFVELTIEDDATGYLLVNVDNVGYYAAIKKGEAIIAMPELAPGNYTVVATYTGDKKYSSATTNETIVIGPSTIISKDLTKVEKGPERFEAKFTYNDGKPLANKDVTFELNGQTYTRTTDANGTAGMNINLATGNYKIITTNTVTKESVTNSITVLPRLEGNDLTKYYKNASQYRVKVYDDAGKPVKSGEIVTFNINGIFYNRTTDENGYAQLTINLDAGNYRITSEYKGCKISNDIKVLPVLSAEDITMKYRDGTAFKANLVDGQGKPYANQNVIFNINGVMYPKTTDSSGIAGLTINLMPGVYIITSMFNGETISNKITITN